MLSGMKVRLAEHRRTNKQMKETYELHTSDIIAGMFEVFVQDLSLPRITETILCVPKQIYVFPYTWK